MENLFLIDKNSNFFILNSSFEFNQGSENAGIVKKLTKKIFKKRKYFTEENLIKNYVFKQVNMADDHFILNDLVLKRSDYKLYLF